jgi:hypothetical protein
MKIRLEWVFDPGTTETKITVSGRAITVDNFLMTFPADDGDASNIFIESGGKILQAYIKNGEPFVVVDYHSPISSSPLDTGKFQDGSLWVI